VPAGREVLLVREDEQPFALVGEWSGGGALVGSEPVEVAPPDADPFAVLADVGVMDGPPPAAGFVGGGWVGYLGFGLGRRLEASHPPPPPRRERLPAFALARYDHVLRLDAEGRWWFEALWTAEREAALEERLAVLRARLAVGGGRSGTADPPERTTWRAEPSPAGHARAVQACRERIFAGDLYQANLALRLRANVDSAEAPSLFAHGVEALGPARAAFVAGDWGALASLSPELYLERRGNGVRSAPIKGTRARPRDAAASEAARAELAASEKDRGENVMIVDLVRNDLGRVCEPGSVAVEALAEVEAHPGVWHLVSRVTGRLAAGAGDAELLRATFPPGSVTGAPKLAAVAAIAELESAERQAFTGAIGFASPAAGLELNVAIRTFELAGGDAWLDVGGGVVADSDPGGEAAEALDKARPLLDAIGGEIVAEGPATGPAAPSPLRVGPRPVARPDPAAGVFETVLVRDGEPVELERHLARLAASVRELYNEALPEDLPERALAEAASDTDCRLRLLATPSVGVAVEITPLPDRQGPLTLAPVTVPGGLGAHKWRDRRLLDALAASVAPGTALLVDLDGVVLEAAWASVLIVDTEGTLVTPPLDGRILPGVTRARALVRARQAGIAITERPIALADLEQASEVMLAGALSGVVAVGEEGSVAASLAALNGRTSA
jgi:para-aminobenzoate synthetase/4-amino-4-deoxychorismate lyase